MTKLNLQGLSDKEIGDLLTQAQELDSMMVSVEHHFAQVLEVFVGELWDEVNKREDDKSANEIIHCALCGEPVKRSEADHHLLHVHKHEP